MSDAINSSLYGNVQLSTENTTLLNSDPFWTYSTIDGTRWCESYPYQLLVLVVNSVGAYGIDQTFTLPIPPQELREGMPSAISTSVTLGGIVEMHNGAPIRPISFSGTTGVLPARPSAAVLPSLNLFQAIQAGSISSIVRTAKAGANLVSAITGAGPGNSTNPNANVVYSADTAPGGDLEKTTGYYQFLLMRKFIESYLALKKTAKGANYRMAFASWKEQDVWIGTPKSFNLSRTASSPWEYKYSFDFIAWKRIQLNGTTGNNPVTTFEASSYSPGTLDQMTQAVNATRTLVQSASGLGSLLQGVLGDAGELFETMRSLVFYAEDTQGITPTLADLPSNILQALQPACLTYLANQDTNSSSSPSLSLAATGGQFSSSLGASLASLRELGNITKASVGSGNVSGLGSSLSAQTKIEEAHQANKLFQNPTRNFELFSSISVGNLNIPPAVSALIVAERQRVRAFTRTDFANMRDTLVDVMTQYADACGAGDPTYNATFNRTVPVSIRTPTDDDFSILGSLNESILALNPLAAFGRETIAPSPLDYVAGYAARMGVPFDANIKSKFSIPFPYGSTLEMVAASYLGDPDRWIEIATLNDLNEPYVDEVGFSYPLLSRGSGNEVTLMSANNLELNQLVFLSASNTQRTQRHITNIRQLNQTNYVLTLDGAADLSRFTPVAGATLSAYLPGTVNSQMTIYIPSDAVVNDDPSLNTPSIPGIDPNIQYLQVAGADLLLTQNGDLSITQNGDCLLALGLPNIVQMIKLGISTPKGSLLQHPDFGIGISPGTSLADLSANELLAATRNMFKDNPAFSGITSAAINLSGPSATIAVSVGISGVGQNVPLTFSLD